MSKHKPKRERIPDFIVSELFSDGINPLNSKLNSLIYQAIGAASMCWDSPKSAGEFDSKEASKIAEELREKIKDLIRKI